MAKAIDPGFKKAEFESDNRNVSDLWSKAILTYNETATVPLVVGRFQDTQSMINFGTQEMNQFHKWRHDDKKVDKLRKLFIGNIGFIEAGMKQIISAASTSFPPAAAIGTAMTFVLSAAKSVSADYDVIINFFEDMNNFLQRVSIIATRVPRKQAYQNALLDVFATFLFMIGVTHETIKQGRFKKWAINSVFGGDSNLSGGRKKMDLTLTRLESATQFAILDNSENMIDKQEDLEATLAAYQQELLQNQRIQQRLASSQSLALQNISDTLLEFKDDIKKLLEYSRQQGSGSETKPKKDAEDKQKAANRVRSVITDIPDINSLIRELEKTQVDGMSAWLFEHPVWQEWMEGKSDMSHSITIEGRPGIGKSFAALAAFRHLQQLVQTNPEIPSCAAYFTFRQDQSSFNTVYKAICSIVIQLTDHYDTVREVLEAKIEDEAQYYRLDSSDVQDWWDFFITEVFTPKFNHQLYLVFDGLDELRSDRSRQSFNELMKRVDGLGSKIKVIVTDRSRATNETADGQDIIRVDRDTILPDIRKLIWNRLHSTDNTYEGLRRLSKPTKQRLARKVEQHADGLLYAEQILRYFSGVARESAINKLLDDELPGSLIGLYEMVLDRARRRLDAVSLPIMRTIVVWASFASQWLSLAELNALGKFLFPNEADIVEEKLIEEFTPFFEMSYVSTDVAEVDLSVDPTVLFSDESIPVLAADRIDSKIYVKLKERTMKNFFEAETSSGHEFIMTSSRANSLIFLTSAQMILASSPESTPDTAAKSIFDYAVCNCFKHWIKINPSELTNEELIELASTFVRLITSAKFSAAVLQSQWERNISDLLTASGTGHVSREPFYERWEVWSDITNQLPLETDAHTYWSGNPGDAVWPLAKLFIAAWLNSSDAKTAWRAFWLANDAIKNTLQKGLLDQFFDERVTAGSKDVHLKALEDLSNLASSYKLELRQPALVHYPYAVTLGQNAGRRAANTIYLDYLKHCTDMHQKVRCILNIGSGYHALEDYDQASHWIDKALHLSAEWLGISIEDVELKGRTMLGSIHSVEVSTEIEQAQQQDSNDGRDEMLQLLGINLLNKSRLAYSLHKYPEAANLMRQSRRWRGDIVPARLLLQELEFMWKAGPVYTDIMDMFLEFKPIERLNLMTSPSLTYGLDIRRDRLLLLASARSQRSEDLYKVYTELIGVLDAEEAGSPLRVSFALVKKLLRKDNQGAKALLDQVLDSVTEQYPFKLTDLDPIYVAIDAIDYLSDILFEEFCDMKAGAEKYQLLLDVKGLSRRSLPSTLTITRSSWSASQSVLARMLKKLGPASEYERVMNKNFETVILGLTDSTSFNDAENVDALARLLAMVPAMNKYAKLIYPCRYYNLDVLETEDDHDQQNDRDTDTATDVSNDQSDKNDHDTPESNEESKVKYDLIEAEDTEAYCDGHCFPEAHFTYWDKDNPSYTCLVCTDSMLCRGCYETRLQWNSDPSSKPETEPDFCCSNGLYVSGPVEGWQGVKNGIIYLDADSTAKLNGDGPAEGSASPAQQIQFKQLLEEIQVAWKASWEDYWAGL